MVTMPFWLGTTSSEPMMALEHGQCDQRVTPRKSGRRLRPTPRINEL